MGQMNSVFASVLLVCAGLTVAGCYQTQEGRYRAGIPLAKDTLESRYERPADQIFQAAKATLAFNGPILAENATERTVSAQINNRTVYVRVDEVEPRVGRILVQSRKKGGGADIDLAAEIQTQIALRLR